MKPIYLHGRRTGKFGPKFSSIFFFFKLKKTSTTEPPLNSQNLSVRRHWISWFFSPTMEFFLEEGKQLHDQCSTLVLVCSFNFVWASTSHPFSFYQLNQSSRRFLHRISSEWFECLSSSLKIEEKTKFYFSHFLLFVQLAISMPSVHRGLKGKRWFMWLIELCQLVNLLLMCHIVIWCVIYFEFLCVTTRKFVMFL